MTSRPRALAWLVAAAVAAALAGCGSDEEIPQSEKLPPDITQELRRQLESVGDRVAAGVSGACDDIYSDGDGNIGPINEQLESIPPRVDARIRAALEESIQTLERLVNEECDAIRRDETGTATDPVETVETTPTTTETVETETTPTTETETVPTTPTETEPRDEAGSGPRRGGPTNGPPSGRGRQGPPPTAPPTGERGGAEAPEDGQ